jgi:hypothetical protein
MSRVPLLVPAVLLQENIHRMQEETKEDAESDAAAFAGRRLSSLASHGIV